jgi:hypothetical protein
MRMIFSAKLPHLTQKLATLVQVVWYGLFVAMIVGSWPQPARGQLGSMIPRLAPMALTSPFTPHRT